MWEISKSENALGTAKVTLQKLSKVLKNRNISLETKEKSVELLWNISPPIRQWFLNIFLTDEGENLRQQMDGTWKFLGK